MKAESKQEVLSTLFDESNKTFGMKSKPRGEEPSMFEMLKWQDIEQPWDFKRKNMNMHDPEWKKYPLRIAHEPISEVHDQYRKITKLPDGHVVQDLNNGLLRTVEKSLALPGNPQQTLKEPTGPAHHGDPDYHQNVDWYPKLQTMYRDQYQVKDIKSHNELMHQLELNCKDFHGRYKGEPNVQPDQAQEELSGEEVLSEDEEEIPESASQYNLRKQSTKHLRRARKLDPNNPNDAAKLERRRQRIKKMNATTRWLPNTSFTTYFGKPSWGPYGYQNVNPTVGGIVYGQHMLSHNVQPHRLQNHPHNAQSYNNALRYARNVAEVIPEPPRNCREEDRLNPEQVEELKRRNPLTALPFEDVKKTITDTRGRVQVTDLHIKKPDLVNSLRFASEDGSEAQIHIVEPAVKQGKKGKEQTKPQQSKGTKPRPASARPSKTQPAPQTKPLVETNKQATEKKAKSKKVGFEEAAPQALEDSLTLPDKSSRKFIEEMNRKKEKANRLAPKVGEVNPSLLVQPAQVTSHPRQPNQDLQDMMNIDDILRNPPHMYLSNMQQSELNPKCYKHIPPEWMHRIPYAGKKNAPSIAAKQCFDFGY